MILLGICMMVVELCMFDSEVTETEFPSGPAVAVYRVSRIIQATTAEYFIYSTLWVESESCVIEGGLI